VNRALPEDQSSGLAAAAEQGALSKEPADPRRDRAHRVRVIDFSRPTPLSQEHVRRITRAHEGFCRTAGPRLSAELKLALELALIEVDQRTWGGTMSSLPQPTVVALLELEPLERHALVAIEQPLVMQILERLLGASNPQPQPVERPLSELEQVIARRVFERFVTELSPPWEELIGGRLTIRDVHQQLGMVRIASAAEPVLVVTVEVRIDATSSTLSIVCPADILAAADTGDEDSSPAGPDSESTRRLTQSLSGVPLDVRAEVAALNVPLSSLLELRPGDILPLGARPDDGVTLWAGDRAVRRAQVGRSGRHRAVSLLEVLSESA